MWAATANERVAVKIVLEETIHADITRVAFSIDTSITAGVGLLPPHLRRAGTRCPRTSRTGDESPALEEASSQRPIHPWWVMIL